MIWLFTTLAALGAAFYIAAPFYRESSLRAPAGAPLRHRQRELESSREALLRELKELEFDRRMGKVDVEQYASARADVTRQAAQVLRQIEALHAPREPKSARAPRLNRSRLALEIELEVAVSRARRRMRARQASWDCRCGRTMSASDGFCGSCGQARPAGALSAAQAASQSAVIQQAR